MDNLQPPHIQQIMRIFTTLTPLVLASRNLCHFTTGNTTQRIDRIRHHFIQRAFNTVGDLPTNGDQDKTVILQSIKRKH